MTELSSTDDNDIRSCIWPSGNRLADLANRAVEDGASKLTDFDLLSLVLADSDSADEALAAAGNLLAEHKSLGRILTTPANHLAHHHHLGLPLPGRALQRLIFSRELGLRGLRGTISSGPVRASDERLSTYLLNVFSGERRQVLRVLYFDHAARLISDEVQSRGTFDQVSLYHREVIRRALELDSRIILVARNEVGSPPNWSFEDEAARRALTDAGAVFEIKLMDFVVVGSDTVISGLKGPNRACGKRSSVVVL